MQESVKKKQYVCVVIRWPLQRTSGFAAAIADNPQAAAGGFDSARNLDGSDENSESGAEGRVEALVRDDDPQERLLASGDPADMVRSPAFQLMKVRFGRACVDPYCLATPAT